jgi:hypothetical protein
MFHFKNINSRLYKTNAAIWYSKTCKDKKMTPNYMHIRVNGNNTCSKVARNKAIRHRLNQEIKFLCAKKAPQRKDIQEKIRMYGTIACPMAAHSDNCGQRLTTRVGTTLLPPQ